jgi:serine/threonine-protein kinase
MPDDTQLRDLLGRWEELRGRGETPDLADLCRDCPERLAEVRSVLRDLRRFDPPGDTVPGQPSTPAAAAAAGEDAPTEAFAGSRYRPLRFHARGGQGDVYLARDETLSREVALKRIQPRHGDQAERVRRFVREAEVCGRLQHPGIVPVYDLGRDADGRPYYAMRFIEGESLQSAIERFHSGPASVERSEAEFHDSLEFRQLLARFVAACNAVAYAHSKGVVHRDLKPGNVMLGPFGETLVVDWGIAKVLGSDAPPSAAGGNVDAVADAATRTGDVFGTPAYMSPEQARGETDWIGPAADVYSLGATLYTLLTGAAPFEGDNALVILERVRSGRPAPPRQRAAGVPAALEAVCRKAMAREPADRYATAAELAAEVERWLADAPVSAWREPWGVRVRRWVRQHARLVTGAAAALAVGMAAFGVLVWQSERARRNIEQQRDRALAARQRTREALDAMTSTVTGEALTTQPALSDEQRQFLESVLKYYEEFTAEPGEDREGRERLARAHYRLGMIHYRLGQLKPGVTVFRRAAEFYDRLAADHPGVPQYRRALAINHLNLGLLLADLGNWAEAEAAYRAALAVQAKLAADHPGVPEYRQELAANHYNLGTLLADLGKRADAEAEYRQALAAQAKLAADHSGVPKYRAHLANSHNSLGFLLAGLGRRAEAEAAHRAALAVQEKLAADHPGVPDYAIELGERYGNFGTLVRDNGDPQESLPWYDRAIRTLDPVYAADPRRVTARQFLRNACRGRARALTRLRRFADADNDWDRAVALCDAFWRPSLRLDRAIEFVRAGESARAVAEADALATTDAAAGTLYGAASTLYGIACVYALAAAAVPADAPLADRHAARAVELLRRAVAAGYRDAAHMQKDPDLAALRRRDDFAALLWDLADGAPPAPVGPSRSASP